MPGSGFHSRGITEVGHVVSGPTDTPWGETSEDGLQIQVATQSVDLYSAQSTMEEDTAITRTTLNMVIQIVNASLQELQRILGIPASAFSGDLEDATPTDEVLAFNPGEIGTEVLQLYALGTGPVTTRRIDVPRAKVADIGPLQMAKTGWMLPQATWRVLRPASGYALQITDASS